MGLFGAAHRWGYSCTLPKEDPKNIWITWHPSWFLLTSAFFHQKSANFAMSENTDIDCILVHNFYFFNFFWVFKDFLVNMFTILMISAKLATPNLLKIKIFQNKGYDVIISDYDVTNKFFSHESNYIINVVMWPKFGNSSDFMREVVITSILWGFHQKNHFFEGWSWFEFNNLGLALDMTLKFYTSVEKVLKQKVRKFLGLSPTFVEVTE